MAQFIGIGWVFKFGVVGVCLAFIYIGVDMAIIGHSMPNARVAYVMTLFGIAVTDLAGMVLSMVFKRLQLMTIFGIIACICIGEGTMVGANIYSDLHDAGIHMPSIYELQHG